jgi:hypothetical protein
MAARLLAIWHTLQPSADGVDDTIAPQRQNRQRR